MRFARVHKVAAYILAVLGLVALCAGGELGGAPTLVLVVGVIASWFAEGELLQSPRYLRAWSLVLITALLVEVGRAMFFGLAPLTAAVEFASLLQLSRLANRRTARDYQQITVLALLHLIAATVLGGGLSYAACFLGFVIVTPWAMTLGHLRREIEGNYHADARAGRAGVPIDVARILRSRRVVGAGLLVGSSLLAIPIFALTAVIFIAFPRVGLGMLSVRAGHSTHVTGLGDRVDLSGHGTIRDDPTIVLRIEPPDLGPNPPGYRTFRLRGASFDHYDGRAWTRHPSERHAVLREAAEYSLLRWPVTRTDRPYRIVLDSLEPPVVLLPAHTVAMRVEPRIEGGLARYPEVSQDASGEVRYATSDDMGLVYTAYVPADVREDEGDGAELSVAAQARYLTLPALSPQVVALAHRLTDAEPTALTRAQAVQRYLHTFRYTLRIESGGAERPLEDFLFRSHAGHCEYFSSAMAVLLRVVGVPTRNVTGFLGGTYNRYGRFYAIRQGDAHSWVEVYDPARGWLTFDPTPPAREAPVVRTGLVTELDAMIEALRVRWRRYIVGFDLSTQARMAMRFMRLLEGRRARTPRGVTRPGPTRTTWQEFTDSAGHAARNPWVWLGLVAGASALGYWIARRRRRGQTGATRSAAQRAQVRDAVALARTLDAALAARGHVRPSTRSPVGFALDLERRGAPIAPLARRIAARYAAARFGDEPLREGELEALRTELRQAPGAMG